MKEQKLLEDAYLILVDLFGGVREAPPLLRKYLPQFLGLQDTPTPAQYRRWRSALHEAVRLDQLEGRAYFTPAFADRALKLYRRKRPQGNLPFRYVLNVDQVRRRVMLHSTDCGTYWRSTGRGSPLLGGWTPEYETLAEARAAAWEETLSLEVERVQVGACQLCGKQSTLARSLR